MSATAERYPLRAVGQREFLHTVASLNNHAVQLLTQGSFIDGSQRLKEAAKLIKEMAKYWNGNLTETELRAKLQETRQIVSTFSLTPTDATMDPNHPVVSIRTMSSEYDTLQFHEILTSCTNTRRVKVPFIMDLSQCDVNSVVPADMDYYSCVILYNYGISYDCLAARTTVPPTKRTLLLKANRILQLTRNLSSMQLGNNASAAASYSCDNVRVHQLNAFLTYKLMEIQVALNMPAEYYEYCLQLEQILHVIQARERFFSTKTICAATA
jgi:hypothetical protein